MDIKNTALDRGGQASESPAFDPDSGSPLERLIFNHRPWILVICLVLTVLLGRSAAHLRLAASFESVIPTHQSFIVNYLDNQENLAGLGNTVNIVVQANQGSILDKNYLATLAAINDKVFLLPGVDRSYMQSLWTPSVRWLAVTDNGLDGGPVMPMAFSGSPQDIAKLAQNIQRSGEIGDLIANDYSSSVIRVPLLDIDAATGEPLDYAAFSSDLDQIRQQYSGQGVTLHITGFAMVVGDLIKGLRQISFFFLISALIATCMVFWYTRCVRSTGLVVSCSLLAVLWQLGLLPLMGYSLDPYSVLVPFLIFSIGMSHGAQKMNGIMQDIGRGNSRLVAARMTFRRLFAAGFTALVCDAVGFAVLMTIRIQAIRELAVVASIGVAILIFTNLILLPVFLSYFGVTKKAALRSLMAETAANEGAEKHLVWFFLDLFTQRRYAALAIISSVCLGGVGLAVASHIKVGDIDSGAPELRSNSVYNQDNRYFVRHYSTSSDVFVIMVKTPDGACSQYSTLTDIDNLEDRLNALPAVVSSLSLADLERTLSVEFNEGNYKWYDIVANQPALNEIVSDAPKTIVNQSCDFMTIQVYLKDHKASTLNAVVNTVADFSKVHNGSNETFLMAAGGSGIAAATNLVVAQASRIMLIEVYAAVILLCLVTFRSWRAVLAAILPLVLTSILCEALMVVLGIGVKVATLPVTALGVGIGVDYSIYILSVTLSNLRKGMLLSEAYYRALMFTGKVVMLTGFTLAAAVSTWAFSPIKFQADMGELLAFMFLWNMLGALVLLPALASFLLPKALLNAGAITPDRTTS